MDVVTRVAGDTISSTGIIITLIEQTDDVIQLDNRERLKAQLNRLKSFLLDIRDQFQNEQRTLPEMVSNNLRRMQDEVGKARQLIDRSQWPKQCLDCLLCKPKLSGQIREWKTSFNELFNFPVSHDAPVQIVSSLPRTQTSEPSTSGHGKGKGKRKPDDGFVKLGIQSGKVQLEKWLTEDPHVRIIGVYGMPGFGKTTLLQNVYNTLKVRADVFDVVIWVTVGPSSIVELQDCIARAINLKPGIDLQDSIDMNKMKLLAYLKTKKFLLILDNLWTQLDLTELGVDFVTDKVSKVLFSTRRRDLITEMDADEAMQLQLTPREEGWESFCTVAFKDGHVPFDIEPVARKVADQCCGVPLSINVIAATMKDKTTVDEWCHALEQMQTMDPHFPAHPLLPVEKQLYRNLRWGYDSLPGANLKNCFLYSAMFPLAEEIEVDKLVGMWIAEGFVRSKEPAEGPVQNKEPAVQSKEPAEGPVRSKEPTIQAVQSKIPAEGPVQNKEPTEALVQSKEPAELGPVQSKEPTDLMQTAHNYIKLLVDRHLLKVTRIPNGLVFLKTHDQLHGLAMHIVDTENYLFSQPAFTVGDLETFPDTNFEEDSNRFDTFRQTFPETTFEEDCKRISLYGYDIRSLPPRKLKYTQLVTLILGANKAFEDVPANFFVDLTCLKVLDLSRTQIKLLPTTLWQLTQLEYLDLSHTEIEDISQKIGDLYMLQVLNLS